MRSGIALIALAAGLLAGPAAAAAQMAGIPVAQNGFVNPGTTVAANFGTGNRGTAYGGALAWAPNQRFGVAVGGGYFSPDLAGADGAFTWGSRVAVTLPFVRREGPLGLAVFAGVGRVRIMEATELSVPAGLSVGYRAAIGEQRGVSLYGAPFYRWSRATFEDETVTSSLLRGTLGFDIALLPALGVSIAYEFGSEAGDLEPGPTGSILGIGISWAFGR